MKLLALLTILLLSTAVFAQDKTALEKIIAMENSFALYAGEKDMKSAFLEFLADDAVMFVPERANGKDYWKARPASKTFLSWYPVFADVSANGALGYTTGHAEFRPDGKGTEKVFYTDYFTIWRRQADGSYKAALDVGVSHDKLPNEDKTVVSPKSNGQIADENRPIAANTINQFFDTATTKGLAKAYKTYLAEDARFLREGKFPILGKANALGEVSKNQVVFGKNMTLQSAGDLAYVVTTFDLKAKEKTVEKGNLIQVWKYTGGKWQIVADVIAPIPLEQK